MGGHSVSLISYSAQMAFGDSYICMVPIQACLAINLNMTIDQAISSSCRTLGAAWAADPLSRKVRTYRRPRGRVGHRRDRFCLLPLARRTDGKIASSSRTRPSTRHASPTRDDREGPLACRHHKDSLAPQYARTVSPNLPRTPAPRLTLTAPTWFSRRRRCRSRPRPSASQPSPSSRSSTCAPSSDGSGARAGCRSRRGRPPSRFSGIYSTCRPRRSGKASAT